MHLLILCLFPHPRRRILFIERQGRACPVGHVGNSYDAPLGPSAFLFVQIFAHLDLHWTNDWDRNNFNSCFSQSPNRIACLVFYSVKGDMFGIMSSTFSYVFSYTWFKYSLFSIICTFDVSSLDSSCHGFRGFQLLKLNTKAKH